MANPVPSRTKIVSVDHVRRLARSAMLSEKIRDDQGAIIIETAMSFVLMILMLLGVMECCVMGYTYAVLNEAAREGVRYATVHGIDSSTCSGPSSGCADSSAANVVNDVKNYAKNYSGRLSGMNVAVTYPDGTSDGIARVQVKITMTYKPIFNISKLQQNMSVSSSGRILY